MPRMKTLYHASFDKHEVLHPTYGTANNKRLFTTDVLGTADKSTNPKGSAMWYAGHYANRTGGRAYVHTLDHSNFWRDDVTSGNPLTPGHHGLYTTDRVAKSRRRVARGGRTAEFVSDTSHRSTGGFWVKKTKSGDLKRTRFKPIVRSDIGKQFFKEHPGKTAIGVAAVAAAAGGGYYYYRRRKGKVQRVKNTRHTKAFHSAIYHAKGRRR